MDVKKIKIVTHSLKFHADDVFAVSTILAVLKDCDCEVLRTRDLEVIKSADYVVDVGGVHDDLKNLFDHHQKGGAGMRKNGVPYASFGLVWSKFGVELCGSQFIADKIDKELVQWVDSMDNGLNPISSNIEGLYPYHISTFLESYNPGWKADENDRLVSFFESVEEAKSLIKREIKKISSLIEADELVNKLYESSDNKKLLVMDGYSPMSSDLVSKLPELLFVVFPEHDTNWILKAIREDGDSFVYRKKLPSEWSGNSGLELEKASGVSGAVFCHNHLFIATANSKEAILKMAEIALKN